MGAAALIPFVSLGPSDTSLASATRLGRDLLGHERVRFSGCRPPAERELVGVGCVELADDPSSEETMDPVADEFWISLSSDV